MSADVVVQHRVTCDRPDVQVMTGVTKNLHTCQTCGAEVFVKRGPS